jgi:hypothetical protein
MLHHGPSSRRFHEEHSHERLRPILVAKLWLKSEEDERQSLGTSLGSVAVEIIEGFNKHVSRIFFKYL